MTTKVAYFIVLRGYFTIVKTVKLMTDIYQNISEAFQNKLYICYYFVSNIDCIKMLNDE